MTVVEEIVFFFYRIARWLNWATIVFMKMFKRTITYYFVVLEDGTQLPFTETSNASTLLVIYYTPACTKYLMTPLNKTLTCDEVRREYCLPTTPSYSFLGLSVTVDDTTHKVSPQEFMVVGSTLFSPVFNQWLCKHYLHVRPDKVVATIIDDSVRMTEVNSDVFLMQDKYVIKQI
jgi:hypothetical protein